MLGVDHLAAEVDPVLAKLGHSRGAHLPTMAAWGTAAAREFVALVAGSRCNDGGGLGNMK
jgi:hypothetical protein